MNRPNPFESPRSGSQARNSQPRAEKDKRDWPRIVSFALGLMLVFAGLFALTVSRIAAIGAFSVGMFLMFGGHVHDLFEPTTEKQMRMQINQRLKQDSDAEEEEPEREDFLRQLEQE